MSMLQALFGNPGTYTKTAHNQRLWQDREIAFDISDRKLSLKPGEKPIATFNQVEDTKGNNGEMGKLLITNIRLIWASKKYKRINLSISLNNILSISVKSVHSKLRGGDVQSLSILTQQHGIREKTKYEFQFTVLADGRDGMKDSSIHNVLKSVQLAYQKTRLFRETKLRAVNISESPGNPKMLHGENLIQKIDGIWSLSSDSGNLGTLILTNIRIIWLARLVADHNITIPWCNVASCTIRDSKFDKALVVETFFKGISEVCDKGGYLLGFRLDDSERLANLISEMDKLLASFRKTPILGIDIEEDAIFSKIVADGIAKDGFSGTKSKSESDSEKDEVLGSGFIDGSVKAKNYEIVQDLNSNVDKEGTKYFYCKEIGGLALQELQSGQSLDSLWSYDLPDVSMDF